MKILGESNFLINLKKVSKISWKSIPIDCLDYSKNIALELIDYMFKCDNQGPIDSTKFIMTLIKVNNLLIQTFQNDSKIYYA
ncbi:hypothetical protein BpHYR1_028227 [Brachionus plicatilis]|uniref:Uncharacterized protein n=1 Tax=Brachionus plicatilis TaxID=10195 RepID=A0A3M7R659_BRAPC|nr:hypothetical protein BpHYR1_028227 [Brachionus plicatilis]